MKTKEKYYCIGVKRKCNIKNKDLTTISQRLSDSKYTLVGDESGVYIFTNKTVATNYIKRLKSETTTDDTVLYRTLDMGDTLPTIEPSHLVA